MDKTTKRLLSLVKEKGAPAVAVILGHQSTQRVQRWVREKKIPGTQLGVVAQILDLNESSGQNQSEVRS